MPCVLAENRFYLLEVVLLPGAAKPGVYKVLAYFEKKSPCVVRIVTISCPLKSLVSSIVFFSTLEGTAAPPPPPYLSARLFSHRSLS